MQVLPPNPLSAHLSDSQPPQGPSLPPNPLGAHLGATAAPVAPQAVTPQVPASSPLTAYATKIAQSQNLDPGFVQHLQTLAKADPTFQDRLNAEVSRVSKNLMAEQGAGISGYVHHAIPALAKGVKDAAVMASGVQATQRPVTINGKTEIAHGDTIGLPFMAGFKDLLGMGEKLAPRTAEEAAAHIDDAIAKAKVEESSSHPPQMIENGKETPETGGELGRQIREGLLKAPAIRTVQTKGMSAERAARFQAASAARIKAGGGLAGQLAAKHQLANALPREFFGDWKHFTPQHLDQLAQVVDKAPLQEGEKTHVIDSITNAVQHGVVPTAGDQKLIERVFGKVAGSAVAEERLPSFWDKFVSYTNIPRALRSSGDLSAGLRQGLVVLVTHPKVWANAFAKSVKFFGSENYYQAANAAMENDKWFPLLKKWGVPFTDLGGKVANTEEAYIGSQAAEHLHELPGIKGTPVGTVLKPLSNMIRRSDRAFTGFQNETRFEMAKMLGEKAALIGHDLNDDHLGQSIARVVGTFSGRGVTPKILEGHLTTLNAMMFSPRLMAARLNLMSPVYYAKLDPFARAEALRGARNLVAAIGTVMLAAKMAGAEVNFDPRSSNFAKIKVGNTRIDIAGGFSQQVRFVAQEMTREAISSAGTKSHIGWGQHDVSDLANLTKLARSKAAPIPGLAWDELSGKDFIGQPIKQLHELGQNAPFVSQDAYDAYQKSGSKSVVVDAFLSAIGLGVQSYKDKPVGASTGGNGGGFGDSGGGFGSGDTGFSDNSSGFGG